MKEKSAVVTQLQDEKYSKNWPRPGPKVSAPALLTTEILDIWTESRITQLPLQDGKKHWSTDEWGREMPSVLYLWIDLLQKRAQWGREPDVGGAGQWTLDHRRSLTRHRKQEEHKEKKDRKKESISRPGQRDMEELTAILHKERRELTCTKVIKLLSKIWGGYVLQQPKGKH